MYIFDTTALKPFDIVLVRFPEDRLSAAIRRICNSQYSHAIIYLGNSSFIEAFDPIVTLFSAQRYFFENLDNMKVIRLDDANNLFDAKEAEVCLRSLTSCNYSNDLISFMRHKNINSEITNIFLKDGRWTGGIVCSSLITLPFYVGGISFSEEKEPYYADFGDIEKCSQFKDVTNEVLISYSGKLTEDTIDYFSLQPTGSILEKQAEALIELNELVTQILSDLKENADTYPVLQIHNLDFSFMSWEDIYPYIMALFNVEKGKEIDNLVYNKIVGTGYDNLWFEEVHNKPELFFPVYDRAARRNYYTLLNISKEHDEATNISLSVHRERIEENLNAVTGNFLRCPSKTFHELTNMYRSYMESLDLSIMQYEALLVRHP